MKSTNINKVQRFFKRKQVIKILGEGYIPSEIETKRLVKYFDEHGTLRQCEEWFSTVAKMIANKLPNISKRITKLKLVKTHGTLYAATLRYGKQNAKTLLAETNKRKTSHFKNKVSYWTDLGMSEEEAIAKVSEVQTARSELSPVRHSPREYTIRCVEYWMKKGMPLDEAKAAVSKAQSKPRSPEVVEQWLNTMDAKSDEEKALINLKRGHSPASFMARGYDAETAQRLSDEAYSKRKNFSKSSQDFFDKLANTLGPQYNVFYKRKNKEYSLASFRVDFYVEETKTVVEYFGTFWHRFPGKYAADHLVYNLTSAEVWENDRIRIETLTADPKVNDVIVVWEHDINKNADFEIDKIIKVIKQWN